jgi:hypothetical protein
MTASYVNVMSGVIELYSMDDLISPTSEGYIQATPGNINISAYDSTGNGNVSITQTMANISSFKGSTQSSIQISHYNTFSSTDGSVNSMLVRDDTGSKGLVYSDDYTGNFTTHSVVTKGYVDVALSGNTLEQVLSNGNTVGSQSIIFGGVNMYNPGGSLIMEGNGYSININSEDISTGDETITSFNPYGISLNNYSITNDRVVNFDISGFGSIQSSVQETSTTNFSGIYHYLDNITTTVNNVDDGITEGSITTTVNDTTTGNSSYLNQRSWKREYINNVDDGLGNAFRIEIREQPDDVYVFKFQDDNTGDQYYRQTNNISSYEEIGNSAIGINDTISLDPSGVSLGTGIKSLDTATDDYTQTTHTPTQISLYNISTTNIADIHFEINNDSVLSSITDNGWSTYIENSLSGLSNGSKQQRLQISPNTSIFVTDDKRAGWMQTSDDTTSLMIYCDMDPSVGSTSSVVQIKAHVRGISSDKTIGYAAEITSWVRVNSSSVVQIGTVDYTIKSEFTTASSSFVISGPNMYIDVTGEIGVTIDWTCNVELLYDKNTF